MGAVTVLGVASLVGVVFASSPLVIACTGAVGFFLIGLAGATVYWATCVRSRSIARFATLIGGSHALGVARANPPARIHIESSGRGRRAFREHHRPRRDQRAHMATPNTALAEFSAQREQTQRQAPRKQQVRRMAPRSYDPSHRRHRDFRLGAAFLRAVQHALHLYRHWLALDQPIHQHHAARSDGQSEASPAACCSTCTGRVTWASPCSG